MTTTHYASLVGPLLGVYYPLPFQDESTNRIALNTSRIRGLWCAVYSLAEVEEQIVQWGGIMLGDEYARRLDYDSHVVSEYIRERDDQRIVAEELEEIICEHEAIRETLLAEAAAAVFSAVELAKIQQSK